MKKVPQEENALVRKFAEGDQCVFREIYDQHVNMLTHFAKGYVGDKNDALDIVMDTFMHLWEYRAKLKDLHSIKAYLIVFTRNKCIDFLKHQRVRNKSWAELKYMFDEEDRLFHKFEHEAKVYAKVLEQLEKFEGRQQIVFKKSYIEQVPDKEIAKELAISESAVRSHRSSVLGRLRKMGPDLYDAALPAILFFILSGSLCLFHTCVD